VRKEECRNSTAFYAKRGVTRVFRRARVDIRQAICCLPFDCRAWCEDASARRRCGRHGADAPSALCKEKRVMLDIFAMMLPPPYVFLPPFHVPF
jgi:hypothetical protein